MLESCLKLVGCWGKLFHQSLVHTQLNLDMEIIGSEITVVVGSEDLVLNVLPFGASEKHWNLKTQISPLI
jgi:hypothetical protein